VATLLAITVDRYLYIVKPLKYPMIVTKRRVFLTISGNWLTRAVFSFFHKFINWRRFDFRLRSLCDINEYIHRSIEFFVGYLAFTLILILNIRLLIVAEKQRKRILAETAIPVTASDGQLANKMSATIHGLLHAVKAVKTFSIVVAVGVGFLCPHSNCAWVGATIFL
jgi:hypothetical protein